MFLRRACPLRMFCTHMCHTSFFILWKLTPRGRSRARQKQAALDACPARTPVSDGSARHHDSRLDAPQRALAISAGRGRPRNAAYLRNVTILVKLGIGGGPPKAVAMPRGETSLLPHQALEWGGHRKGHSHVVEWINGYLQSS